MSGRGPDKARCLPFNSYLLSQWPYNTDSIPIRQRSKLYVHLFNRACSKAIILPFLLAIRSCLPPWKHTMLKCTLPASPVPRIWTGGSILASGSWEVYEGGQFWDRMFSSLIKEEGMQRGASSLPPLLQSLSHRMQWLVLLQPSYNHEEKAKTITEELPKY